MIDFGFNFGIFKFGPFRPGPIGSGSRTLRSKVVRYTGRVQVYYIKTGLDPKFSISTRIRLIDTSNHDMSYESRRR